jgi:hypothetical protein
VRDRHGQKLNTRCLPAHDVGDLVSATKRLTWHKVGRGNGVANNLRRQYQTCRTVHKQTSPTVDFHNVRTGPKSRNTIGGKVGGVAYNTEAQSREGGTKRETSRAGGIEAQPKLLDPPDRATGSEERAESGQRENCLRCSIVVLVLESATTFQAWQVKGRPSHVVVVMFCTRHCWCYLPRQSIVKGQTLSHRRVYVHVL